MGILKKIPNFIFNLVTICMIIAIVFGIYYIIQIKVLKKDNANILGYAFFEVATGSMSNTIEIGDVVLVKITNEVQENDIIVFKEEDYFVTHRLIRRDNESNMLITKGDANNSQDKPIYDTQIIGKVIKIIPKVGIWKKVIFSKEVLLLGAILITIVYILIWIKNKSGGEG